MANVIDPSELKTSKKIKTIVAEQQQRIFRLEQMLDDLCRSCEIAQYSQQYTITETYRTEAEELLRDRIVLPEIAPTEGGMKLQIVTGEVSDDINKQITEKAKAAAGIK
jgi:hypothetical protein